VAEFDANEVGKLEFAKRIQRDPALVTRWRKAGKLVMSADGKRVCVRESLARLQLSLDPARGGHRGASGSASRDIASPASPAARIADPAPAMGDLNYQREAARDKRASAQQRELELAKSAGELVEVAAVQHRIADHARAALDFLAARRRRLAPTLALESDPRKVEALLEQSDREFAAAVSRLGTAMDNEAQAA
jgi:hypothetical protein